MLIKDAAGAALEVIGRPATVDEIYEAIISKEFYTFNTDVPQHVLRTTLKRHSAGSDRIDASDEILFMEVEPELFSRITQKPESRKMRTPGTKRIHRAKDKEAIISELTSADLGVFKENWRLLIFAATLGHKSNRREPLISIDQGKGIDQATFGNCPAWPGILYLLALNETQSEEVMKSSEEAEDLRIKIFEEYANGGLSLLSEHFSKSDFEIASLVNLVADSMEASAAPKPDLSI